MATHVIVEDLKKRHGLRCYICHRSLKKEWNEYKYWWNDGIKGMRRGSRKNINLNVDHVIPVAKGRNRDMKKESLYNLRLVHRTCNDWKGDKVIV